MKFLELFIKDETQKKWAKLGGYTCSQVVLKSKEFQEVTPYNKASIDSTFMVKGFWVILEYAEVLDQMNQNIYPFIVGGKGTAQEALRCDGQRTGRRHSRSTIATSRLSIGDRRGPSFGAPRCLAAASKGGRAMTTSVTTEVD